MRAVATTSLAFLTTVLMASSAMAATTIDTKAYDALTAMKGTNVIVLGNYTNTGNGDIEGKLWVGGNSSGSKMQVGFGNSNQSAGQSAAPTMTVVGNFTNSGVDLYNGNTKNGTVGTWNGSATGSYGLTVGGNMTDTNNGLDTKANNGSIKVGGSLSRLSLDGANQTVMINGSLSNFAENAANSTIRAQSYSGNVNGLASGSSAYISGANPSQNTPPAGWNFNQTQTLNAPTTASMASEVSTMSANMTDLSVQLSSLATTSSILKVDGGSGIYDILFNATGTSNGYATFTVSASDLLGARGIGFELNGGSFNGSTVPIIVNITGLGSGNYNWGLQSGVTGYGSAVYNSSLSSNILWNLVGATGTLNVNATIEGSVLSASGTISTNSSANIEGTIVANSFSQGGEVHLGTFNGGDSGSSALSALATTSAAAVPETGIWVMMILGFGLVGGMARRRKQVGAGVRI